MNLGFNSAHWHFKPQIDATPVARQYPITALPRALREAGLYVSVNNRLSETISVMTAVGAASIAMLGLVAFKMPNGRKRSASLFLIVLADSGTGKTTAADIFMATIRAYDEANEVSYKQAVRVYETKHSDWRDKRRELSKMLAKLLKDGQLWEHLQVELDELTGNEPIKPRSRRLLVSDITGRAWINRMEGKGQSIGFACDEGEVIFDSVHRYLGHLNRGWDGSPISVDRAGDVSIMAYDPHIGMLMLSQHSAFNAFQKSYGEKARGIGHWARYLFAAPPKVEGRRYSAEEVSSSAVDVYHARMNELHAERDRRLREGITDPDIVELDDDARACWINFANEMNQRTEVGQDLCDVSDFAAKAAEHAGRLATNFSYFNKQDKITLDTIERAITIIRYHLAEYQDRFSLISSVPGVVLDAEWLDKYLRRVCSTEGWRSVLRSHVKRNAKGDLRDDPKRIDAAMELLAHQGKIRLIHGAKNTCRIECCFSPIAK